MPGLDNELVIAIPNNPHFYSLYADGLFSRKVYIAETHLYLVYHLFGAAEFPYSYDFINTVNIASETPVPILSHLTAEEKN
jgi:hypothetical protein